MKKLIFIFCLGFASISNAQGFVKFYPPPGIAELTSNGTLIVSTLPFALPDGLATDPALRFAADPDTGIYRGGANLMAFATNGAFLAGMNSAGFYVATGAFIGISTDTFLYRDGAGIFAQRNGNNDQFRRLYGANNGYWEDGVNSELLTISTDATTDTTGNLLPANAIIKSVMVRVTTVIPTAATFNVGDATTAARFASGVSTAANTTIVGLAHMQGDVTTTAAGPTQTTAAKVRITPNVSPAAATGVVRVEVAYSKWVPPTT